MYVKLFDKDSVDKLESAMNEWIDNNPLAKVVEVIVTPVQHFNSTMNSASYTNMKYLGVIKYTGSRVK